MRVLRLDHMPCSSVKEALRSTPQAIRAPGAWPAIFYQNLESDTQRPWEGFLRNHHLLMVIAGFTPQTLPDRQTPGLQAHICPPDRIQSRHVSTCHTELHRICSYLGELKAREA
jgi:hypothetical protein